MAVQPRLADLPCSKIRFRAGDRVLVRCHHMLAPEQRKKLTSAIQRWAGADVEVLIYDPLDMDITVEHINAGR